MDFEFSEEEQAFATEVAAFLQEVHSDDVMQPWKENFTQLVDTQPKRDFLKKLADKGWLGITWPKELGGQEGPGVLEYLLNEALAYVGAPQIGKGIGIIGKTLIRHGSDKLKAEFLPKILNAEVEFAVGYSEPQAGSDAANMQLRADKVEGGWNLNGQKIWTSGAAQAQWMFGLFRTDPEAPKHRGITMFLLDMRSAGIATQPIVTAKETAGIIEWDINEVFFEDVRIPVANRIGEENKGFTYQMTQFQEERLWAAANMIGGLEDAVTETTDYARQRQAFGRSILDNQVVHFRLAELSTEIESLCALTYQACEQYVAGDNVTRLASMAKLKAGRLGREVADACLQYFGGQGYMAEARISRLYRDVRLASIGAGADEIMLTIICKQDGTLPGQQ